MSGSTERTARSLWLSAGSLSMALIAVMLWKAWPQLFPRQALQHQVSACDLHQGTCQVDFADGQHLQLSLSPRPVRVLELLQIEAQLTGIKEVEKVELDIVGLNMYMGFNRPLLQPQQSGLYQGTGMLPVCTQSEMQWEVRALIHTHAGLYSAGFKFNTQRSNITPPQASAVPEDAASAAQSDPHHSAADPRPQ